MGIAFTEHLLLLTWRRCYKTAQTSQGFNWSHDLSCDTHHFTSRLRGVLTDLKTKIAAKSPSYDYDEFHEVVRTSIPS